MKTTHKFGYLVKENNLKIEGIRIIQVDIVGDSIFYEVVNESDFKNTLNNSDNEDLENADFTAACETELKTDPFKSGWHNGHKLIDIRKNDPDWWNKALKELKNNFIISKMKVIEEGIKNGKIYN